MRPYPILLSIAIAIALPTQASAGEDIADLYQFNCISCHGAEVYTRTDRKVTSLESDALFLLRDGKGVRVPSLEGVKNCWPRACEALELERPWPRFHDLRHTWKTNARRSGMDPEIRESIMVNISVIHPYTEG